MFYVIQLIMIVVAFCSSREEFYATYAYRQYVPPGTTESKKFHSWGAATIVSTLLGLWILGAASIGFLSATIAAFLGGTWYWLLFDPLYAVLIKKPWDYLGDEADMDVWLKHNLGKNAGKKKAFIVAAFILIANICYTLFL